ncbi:hypothetical protein O6H91_Y034900 [Diphasiastrum complanatum]|nr:hypothetical protein O6H91_Y034900 [Diphasiastrum complanatum]
MAQLEKGQAIEENQTRDAENTRASPNFSNMTHEHAHDTDVDIETGPEAANRGSLVTTLPSTMDIGVNRAGGSSFKVKTWEIQNLVFGTAMVVVDILQGLLYTWSKPHGLC